MFFFYDRDLLTKLAYAVNDVFKYQFHNIKAKIKEFIKFQNIPLNTLLTQISFIMD